MLSFITSGSETIYGLCLSAINSKDHYYILTANSKGSDQCTCVILHRYQVGLPITRLKSMLIADII